MKSDYFDSPDFQELLSEYEYAKKMSLTKYFDEDEIADLSDYYVERGTTRQAHDVLTAGLRLHPASNNLKLMLAGVKLCDHKFEEANSLLGSLNDDAKKNNDFYYVSAQLFCALHNDWEEADRLFSQWIDLENADIDADSSFEEADELKRDNYLHILSSIREFVADKEVMFKALEKWIDKYMDFFSPAGLGNSETDVCVGEICREENLSVCCERLYTLMLETNPYLDGGWAMLAAAQYANGKYEECIDSIEFALAIDPNDCNALMTKAHCLYNQNRYEDALQAFRKFSDVLDTLEDDYDYKCDMLEDCSMFIGICLVRLECWDEATPHIDRAIIWNRHATIEPDAKAWNCREVAECLMSMERYNEALEMIDRAMAIIPDCFDFLQTKGELMLYLNEIEMALECFSRSAKLCGNDAVASLATGVRFLNARFYSTATLMFESVLQMDTDVSKNAYAYLAYAYYKLDNMDKCLSYIETAIKECPSVLMEVFGVDMNELGNLLLNGGHGSR